MSIFSDALRQRLRDRASELESSILRGLPSFEDYRVAVARYREIQIILEDMTQLSKDFAISFNEEEEN